MDIVVFDEDAFSKSKRVFKNWINQFVLNYMWGISLTGIQIFGSKINIHPNFPENFSKVMKEEISIEITSPQTLCIQTPSEFPKTVGFYEYRSFKKDYIVNMSFEINNFKNSIFQYRQNAELLVKNLLSLYIGQQLKLFKLNKSIDTQEMAQICNEIQSKTPEENSYFHAEIAFSNQSTVPIVYLGSTRILEKEHGEFINYILNYKKIDIFNHQKIKLITHSRNSNPEKRLYANYVIPRIRDRRVDLFAPGSSKFQLMYIKPSGLVHLDYFINELLPIISIQEIVVKCLTLEEKQYLYPNAIKRPYGPSWYSYLGEAPAIFIKFTCVTDKIEDFDSYFYNFKTNWRKASGESWVRNVCHTATNENEFNHFQKFYEQLKKPSPNFDYSALEEESLESEYSTFKKDGKRAIQEEEIEEPKSSKKTCKSRSFKRLATKN